MTGWRVLPAGGGNAHVAPTGDLIDHQADEACVCGPNSVPVERPDGSVGWLLVHHSLDGREQQESTDGPWPGGGPE